MKKIYDTVKSLQTQRPIRYNTFDEDYDDEYYPDEDDYSDDEGTKAPIHVVSSTNSYTPNIPKPKEEPYSKLLSGYTNDNQEINVNNVHDEKLMAIIIIINLLISGETVITRHI